MAMASELSAALVRAQIQPQLAALERDVRGIRESLRVARDALVVLTTLAAGTALGFVLASAWQQRAGACT
jgi:tetrahydromethanopterin S-methyltransferase subunit F